MPIAKKAIATTPNEPSLTLAAWFVPVGVATELVEAETLAVVVVMETLGEVVGAGVI